MNPQLNKTLDEYYRGAVALLALDPYRADLLRDAWPYAGGDNIVWDISAAKMLTDLEYSIALAALHVADATIRKTTGLESVPVISPKRDAVLEGACR